MPVLSILDPRGYIHGMRKGRPVDDPDGFQPAIENSQSVPVMVAGGPGLYSTIMAPWAGGAHGNIAVSKEIVMTDACEVVGLPVQRALEFFFLRVSLSQNRCALLGDTH